MPLSFCDVVFSIVKNSWNWHFAHLRQKNGQRNLFLVFFYHFFNACHDPEDMVSLSPNITDCSADLRSSVLHKPGLAGLRACALLYFLVPFFVGWRMKAAEHFCSETYCVLLKSQYCLFATFLAVEGNAVIIQKQHWECATAILESMPSLDVFFLFCCSACTVQCKSKRSEWSQLRDRASCEIGHLLQPHFGS